MGVTTRPIGHRHTSGIAWITVPSDKDTSKFIERCYRNGTVSIILENGGVVESVLISKQTIKEIEFPKSSSELGSLVCWINKPENNQPIIVGSFPKDNELNGLTDGRANLLKRTGTGFAEVIVDGVTGSVTIIASGLLEKGGDINIISNNKSRSSKLKVNVSGNVIINSDNFQLTNSKKLQFIIKDKSVNKFTTSISYEKGVGFDYIDEFGNQISANKDNIKLTPAKILNISEGSEPIAKADSLSLILEKLVDLCSNIADEISLITVPTAMGISGVPTNANKLSIISTSLSDLKNQFDDFKSKISNTD